MAKNADLKHDVGIGDTLTPYGFTLTRDGSAINGTGLSLKWKLINSTGGEVVAKTATGISWTDQANGEGQIDFPAAAVASAGVYWFWIFTESGGEQETWPPNKRGIKLVVSDQEGG